MGYNCGQTGYTMPFSTSPVIHLGCLVSINGHSVSVWAHSLSDCVWLFYSCGYLVSLCVYSLYFCVSVVCCLKLVGDRGQQWEKHNGSCDVLKQPPLSWLQSFSHQMLKQLQDLLGDEVWLTVCVLIHHKDGGMWLRSGLCTFMYVERVGCDITFPLSDKGSNHEKHVLQNGDSPSCWCTSTGSSSLGQTSIFSIYFPGSCDPPSFGSSSPDSPLRPDLWLKHAADSWLQSTWRGNRRCYLKFKLHGRH